MWRLLLARLHPDAGGDGALFAFASAVRDEGRRTNPAERATASDDGAVRPAAPFLRSWRHTMGHWASSNRDALKGSRTRT